MNTNTDNRKNDGPSTKLFRLSHLIIAAIPLVAAAGFIEDLHTRQGVDDWVWYLVSLALTIFLGGRLLPMMLAALFSALTLLGYYYSPPGADPGLALDNCLMGMGLLWITGILIFLRQTGESERRKLACAVRQSPASILITDLRGTIEYVNPAFCVLTGYSREEVRGQNPRILKSGKHAREFYKAMWDVLLQGKVWRGEMQNKKKNGELYWLSACISPVRDHRGQTTHYVAIREDITERRRMEEDLRQSEAKFRQFAENVRAVFWMISADWSTLLYVSPAYEEIWGRPCKELYAKPTGWLDGIHPEDRPRVLAATKTDYSGFLEGIEYRVLRPDGSMRWIRDRAYVVRDGSGQTERVVGVAEDISENKRAAQQLAELEASEQRARLALAHEQELNMIKSRFVGMVSHEFRTPLSVISAAAQLLTRYSDQMDGEERAEQLKEIEQATGRMTQMMNDLLLFGRLEAGKMECKPARVDLETLCRQIISDISSQTGNLNRIEVAIAPDARSAFLDQKIFEHILGNLLSNAVKYSPGQQPVMLEARRVESQALPVGAPEPRAADYLEMKVSDSGIGIPAGDLEKIFHTFHRAANIGNRPGTGMGLAIVKQSVDLHRGSIHVQSTEGKGTTVSVWLPVSSPEPPHNSRTNH